MFEGRIRQYFVSHIKEDFMVEMMEIQPHEVGAKGDKDSPTRSPLTFKVCYFLNF